MHKGTRSEPRYQKWIDQNKRRIGTAEASSSEKHKLVPLADIQPKDRPTTVSEFVPRPPPPPGTASSVSGASHQVRGETPSTATRWWLKSSNTSQLVSLDEIDQRPSTTAKTAAFMPGGAEEAMAGAGAPSNVLSIHRDPLVVLREVIKTMMKSPAKFGSNVATTLMDTYKSVVTRHFELGDDSHTLDPTAPAEDTFVRKLTGESEILAQLRETKGAMERIQRDHKALLLQVDILESQVAEKAQALAAAEKVGRIAEMHEAEVKNKLASSQNHSNALQAEVVRLREVITRMQQEAQQTNSVDDKKLQERTADLRAELARLYEMVKGFEDNQKSYEREVNNLKSELEELDSKHTTLLKDHDASVEEVGRKLLEIDRLENVVKSKDKKIAELEVQIKDLKLEVGSTLVQQSYIQENWMWRLYKEKLLAKREELIAHLNDSTTPVAVKKAIKPL